MATKLQIWNRALYHLGEGKVVDTDPDVDGTEPAYVFDEVWETIVEDALSRGDWNFAIVTTEVSESTTTTVIPGYDYAFDHPDDWIRTVALSFDGDFTDTSLYGPEIDVYDERESWFCNSEYLYARYVSSTYAGDSYISTWPPSFVEFLAVLLAEQTCERITQGTEKQDDLEEKVKTRLLKAKSNDARNQPPQRVRTGNWLRSMRGNAQRRGYEGTMVGGEIDTVEGST